MNEGFIKIYRQLLEWEWYTDVNTKVLFLHCLLKANYKTKKYQKNTVKKGSFVTSLESLSKETGLTIRQTRTALEHLISTGELTNKSSSKSRIITVVNYDKYQDADKQNDKQTTSKRQTKCQASDKQATNDRQATDNSRRKKEVYVSPTEIHIREEGKKPAAPGVAGGSTGLPSVREMRTFARTVPGSTDDMACSFHDGFEISGTVMPENWQELYARFVSADDQTRLEFVTDLKAGKYKGRWN